MTEDIREYLTERKYTHQMPFVCTGDQRSAVEEYARERKISRAAAIRDAIDRFFGLKDGENPEREVSA